MVPGCSARLYLCFKNYMFVLRGVDWSFAGGDSFQFVVRAQALEADLGSVLTSVVTSVISRWAYHTSLSLAFLSCQKGATVSTLKRLGRDVCCGAPGLHVAHGTAQSRSIPSFHLLLPRPLALS